jgi:predicted permease
MGSTNNLRLSTLRFSTPRFQTIHPPALRFQALPLICLVSRNSQSGFVHSRGRPLSPLLLACPISIITPLKALFVPLQNSNGNPVIPFAPDGAPPLAFILDTATFLGSASVPLALMCLGAALAKLKLPKGIRELPLGAILALTIGRLVLQPIIAVVTVDGLVKVGLIDEANKVLRFTMMWVSHHRWREALCADLVIC